MSDGDQLRIEGDDAALLRNYAEASLEAIADIVDRDVIKMIGVLTVMVGELYHSVNPNESNDEHLDLFIQGVKNTLRITKECRQSKLN